VSDKIDNKKFFLILDVGYAERLIRFLPTIYAGLKTEDRTLVNIAHSVFNKEGNTWMCIREHYPILKEKTKLVINKVKKFEKRINGACFECPGPDIHMHIYRYIEIIKSIDHCACLGHEWYKEETIEDDDVKIVIVHFDTESG
jgi:hypothetical protein